MRVHLMSPDSDFEVPGLDRRALPDPLAWHVADMMQDLQVDVVLDAMAAGDDTIRSVCRTALLEPPARPEDIAYRSAVLADFQARPQLLAQLYRIATGALQRPRSLWLISNGRPESLLRKSQTLLTHMAEGLDQLRPLVDAELADVSSPGLKGFAATIRDNLPDDYMADLHATLEVLDRRSGVLMLAGIGPDGGVARPDPRVIGTVGRFFHRLGLEGRTGTWTLPDRDEAGAQAMQALRDRALRTVARAAEQASIHVRSFFSCLRDETAFYLGCLNLRSRLEAAGMPVAIAQVAGAGGDVFGAESLYDPGLVLRTGGGVVGNDVDTGSRGLLVVTGANHGGKTTLLRSIGLAQLLADAGAYVPAARMSVSQARGVYTHWQREEDQAMKHGKLDEELSRIGRLAEVMRPGSLLLSNESFASTNEAEGSQIGLEAIRGFVAAGVRVAAVTHLYDLAETICTSGEPAAVFLRAERGENGERSYRIPAGPPLPTAYARDFYRREFGAELPGAEPSYARTE